MDLVLVSHYKQLFQALDYTPTSDDIFKIADRAIGNKTQTIESNDESTIKAFVACRCTRATTITKNTVTAQEFVIAIVSEHDNFKKPQIYSLMSKLGYERRRCKTRPFRDIMVFPQLRWAETVTTSRNTMETRHSTPDIETAEEEQNDIDLDQDKSDDDASESTISTHDDNDDRMAEETDSNEEISDPDIDCGKITVYCLELQDDCYYIGRTTPSGFVNRIACHDSGEGTAWTILHPFIKVAEVIEDASGFTEDNTTLEYMKKYGIDNVRGGQYTTVTLSTNSKSSIQKAIASAGNQCFICSSDNHFANACPQRRKRKQTRSGRRCSRCRRNTHTAKTCYALTKLDGTVL